MDSEPNESAIDRSKLKEERRLRNIAKRAAKRLNKEQQREQELLLKLQPKSCNVTIITRDFADQVAGFTPTVLSQPRNAGIKREDFPSLGESYKVLNKTKKCEPQDSYSQSSSSTSYTKHKWRENTEISLADLIVSSQQAAVPKIKPKIQPVPKYSGNPLDSSMPERKVGKHREIPKVKKISKLKQDIKKDKEEQGIIRQNDDIDTSRNEPESESSMYIYYDNIVTDALNEAVTTFLKSVVALQEKLYKRDPIKGTAKRKYVVGFHETKKHLKLNRVKIIVIASDICVLKANDALDTAIKEMVDIAKGKNIPHLFALRRRQIGKLVLKHIPISCVGILNYESAEGQFRSVIDLLSSARQQFDELSMSEQVQDSSYEVNVPLLQNLMEALK